MNKSHRSHKIFLSFFIIGSLFFSLAVSPVKAMLSGWGRVYYRIPNSSEIIGLDGVEIQFNPISAQLNNLKSVTTQTVSGSNPVALTLGAQAGTDICAGNTYNDDSYDCVNPGECNPPREQAGQCPKNDPGGSVRCRDRCKGASHPCSSLNQQQCAAFPNSCGLCNWIKEQCVATSTLFQNQGVSGAGYWAVAGADGRCNPDALDCGDPDHGGYPTHSFRPQLPCSDSTANCLSWDPRVPKIGHFTPTSWTHPQPSMLGNNAVVSVNFEWIGEITPTPTPTLTPTLTPTATPTTTPSSTPTVTPTATPTSSPPPSPTPTIFAECETGGKKFDDTVDQDKIFNIPPDSFQAVQNWHFSLYEVKSDGSETLIDQTVTSDGAFQGLPNSFKFTGLDCSKTYRIREEKKDGWTPWGDKNDGVVNGEVTFVAKEVLAGGYHFGNCRTSVCPNPELTNTPTPVNTVTATPFPSATFVPPTATPLPPTATTVPAATNVPTQAPAGCNRRGEGDANCNGVINNDDYIIWLSSQCQINCADTKADFDGNGKIDDDDYRIWDSHKISG